jgi:photosystem I subunit 9
MSSGFQRYLSSAPVLAILTLVVLTSALIEFNRFFPDLLFHP